MLSQAVLREISLKKFQDSFNMEIGYCDDPVHRPEDAR
jgi:hypothetical protein